MYIIDRIRIIDGSKEVFSYHINAEDFDDWLFAHELSLGDKIEPFGFVVLNAKGDESGTVMEV